MKRELRDSVVVITGASSGIGRAAALEFARRGATVVLAARRRHALESLAAECRREGANPLVAATDVTDEAAVQQLARVALESFGRIDVWINNAAVTLFSRFEDAPPEVYRRVIETNLFGYIHGARAALPCFREQQSGVLINVASQVASFGMPYVSAYTLTKWAIRGLGECLRQELLGTDVHICTLLPGSIDTPLYQHAANYTGRAVKPLEPVEGAHVVARAIVELAEHPKREVHVGGAARLVGIAHKLAPGLVERLMARKVERDHFRDEPAPRGDGNLFEPMAQFTSTSGGWRQRLPSRLGRYAAAGIGALAAAALAWSVIRETDSAGTSAASPVRSLVDKVAAQRRPAA